MSRLAAGGLRVGEPDPVGRQRRVGLVGGAAEGDRGRGRVRGAGDRDSGDVEVPARPDRAGAEHVVAAGEIGRVEVVAGAREQRRRPAAVAAHRPQVEPAGAAANRWRRRSARRRARARASGRRRRWRSAAVGAEPSRRHRPDLRRRAGPDRERDQAVRGDRGVVARARTAGQVGEIDRAAAVGLDRPDVGLGAPGSGR